MSGNLSKKFDEVRQIISKELCTYDKVFAGVVGEKLSTEELALSNDPQSGPPLGILRRSVRCQPCPGSSANGLK